jgi:hypothetical protein
VEDVVEEEGVEGATDTANVVVSLVADVVVERAEVGLEAAERATVEKVEAVQVEVVTGMATMEMGSKVEVARVVGKVVASMVMVGAWEARKEAVMWGGGMEVAVWAELRAMGGGA